MIKTKSQLIRVLLFIVSMVMLAWNYLNAIELNKWHQYVPEVVLFIITFLMISNGISYLVEVRKDGGSIALLIGVMSLIVFIIAFFPQNQESSPIVGWAVFICFTISSILNSRRATLEWIIITKYLKWGVPFLFALFSGISGFVILAFIYRGYNYEQGYIAFITFGVVLCVLCLINNYFAVIKLNLLEKK